MAANKAKMKDSSKESKGDKDLKSAATLTKAKCFRDDFKYTLKLKSPTSGVRKYTLSPKSKARSKTQNMASNENQASVLVRKQNGGICGEEAASRSSSDEESTTSKCCCCCTSALCGKSRKPRDDETDTSLIREPLNLGSTNVKQILQCVHNGTAEVKDVILNECNIIYECKACKNLFRSLANFLSHKRFYCTKHFCENMMLFDGTFIKYPEDVETLNVQEEKEEIITIGVDNELCSSASSSGPSHNDGESSSPDQKKMDLHTSPSLTTNTSSEESPGSNKLHLAIERMAAKKTEGRLKRTFSQVCENKAQKENERSKRRRKPSCSMKLIRIPTNQNAVFQKIVQSQATLLSNMNDQSAPKSEQSEQSDGKAKSSEVEATKPSISSNAEALPMGEELNSKPSNPFSIHLSSKLKVAEEGQSQVGIHQASQGTSLFNGSDTFLRGKVRSNNFLMSENHNNESRPCATSSSSSAVDSTSTKIQSRKPMVYPCPFCCSTFNKISRALRHMAELHRKDKTQIEHLKEVVKLRAYPQNREADSSSVESYEDESSQSSDYEAE